MPLARMLLHNTEGQLKHHPLAFIAAAPIFVPVHHYGLESMLQSWPRRHRLHSAKPRTGTPLSKKSCGDWLKMPSKRHLT